MITITASLKRYALLTLFLVFRSALATTLYVDLNSPNPTAPYSTWATASMNIQDAVDLAGDGDIVWVTNGTYYLSQQITVTSDIVIQSVNGKDVTIVDGGGTTRCFSLGGNACRVDGFSIVNGRASTSFYTENERFGGGARCSNTNPVLANCTFKNHLAAYGGALQSGTVSNCVFIANTAAYRGGASHGGSHVRDSIFINNTAGAGGAMETGYAVNCVFHHNLANSMAGGMSGGTADYCYFSENTSGALVSGTANFCTFVGNSRGGMILGTANSCLFLNNQSSKGGAIYEGTANICTMVSNTATEPPLSPFQ